MSSGGAIQILSTLTASNVTATINAPLAIQGANGTYTLANNSANGTGAGAGTLNIRGAIKGGAVGNTVLTLAGTNTNSNTISGVIWQRLGHHAGRDQKWRGDLGSELYNSTLQLDRATGASGSHTEIVGSIRLYRGASITRGVGSTAVLRMNSIIRNVGSTVNFGAASIADTDNVNTNGLLGTGTGWATIGGTDFAMNSTNAADGPITTYTGYTNVTRQSSGTKVNANGSTTMCESLRTPAEARQISKSVSPAILTRGSSLE